MWRCAHCGDTVSHGTICLKCGQPIDEALNAIAMKVRGLPLRGGVAERWMARGAKTGFFAGLVLSPILIGICVILRCLSSPPWQRMPDEDFFLMIVVIVLDSFICFPILFAIIFLVFGSLIKPIWVALFCSIERFEQEYGSTEY